MNRFLKNISRVNVNPPYVPPTRAPHVDVPLIKAPVTAPAIPPQRFDLLESALNISSMRFVTPMWLQYSARAFSALPYIIAGIQHVHGDALSGVEKKNLALEALGVAYMGAEMVDPVHAPQIQAVTSMAGTAIDAIVTLMHAAKEAPAGLPALAK